MVAHNRSLQKTASKLLKNSEIPSLIFNGRPVNEKKNFLPTPFECRFSILRPSFDTLGDKIGQLFKLLLQVF